MSTELDTPFTVVSPATGEVLTLDAASDRLAEWLLDVRAWESQAREAKRVVTAELLSRMDRNASWTIRAGDLKITGASPAPEETWDGAELRSRLLELVDQGVLSVEAVDAAVETVITYRPKKSGINALRRLGGQAAEIVDELVVRTERDRRITVSR